MDLIEIYEKVDKIESVDDVKSCLRSILLFVGELNLICKEVFIMKRSKFIALLLVCVFTLGSISTAFASTDNTSIQPYDYAKNNTKYKASVAAPAVAAATGTAIVVGGIATSVYAISKFIDWVW